MTRVHDSAGISNESCGVFDEVDENDDHLRIFGKKASDLKYSDIVCQFCRTRIDEIGWCGCDTIGGG
jgi:hypothetical protein